MYETILQNIMILLPILILQLGLMIFCIVKILRDGVENLSKPAWMVIVILCNLLGAVLFLIVGRKRDAYDSGE